MPRPPGHVFRVSGRFRFAHPHCIQLQRFGDSAFALHKGFDFFDLSGNPRIKDFAAFFCNKNRIFHPDAEVVAGEGGKDIAGKDHPGFEDSVGRQVTPARIVGCQADVMGNAALLEETQPGECIPAKIVAFLPEHVSYLLADLVACDARPVQGQTALTDFQAGLVDLMLAWGEPAVNGEGDADVHAVILDLGAGIDHQEVTIR